MCVKSNSSTDTVKMNSRKKRSKIELWLSCTPWSHVVNNSIFTIFLHLIHFHSISTLKITTQSVRRLTVFCNKRCCHPVANTAALKFTICRLLKYVLEKYCNKNTLKCMLKITEKFLKSENSWSLHGVRDSHNSILLLLLLEFIFTASGIEFDFTHTSGWKVAT